MRRAGTQMSPEPMECKESCERLILSLLYFTKGTSLLLRHYFIFFYRYFAYHIILSESSAKQKLRHFSPGKLALREWRYPPNSFIQVVLQSINGNFVRHMLHIKLNRVNNKMMEKPVSTYNVTGYYLKKERGLGNSCRIKK